MSKYLGATLFRDLLPHSIATDPTMQAAADALDTVLNRSVASIPDVLLFARLANDSGFVNPVPMLAPMTRLADLREGLQPLPENMLDLLAWQLHVEGYEATASLQAKRELIQGSLLLHRRKGTPWAVWNALQTALCLPASVREWYQYGGNPYFFRVGLDVTGQPFDITCAQNAFRLIDQYKNVRSWLDLLETKSTNPLPVSVLMGVISRNRQFTRMYFPVSDMPELPVRVTLAVVAHDCMRERLHFAAHQAPALPVAVRLAVVGSSAHRSRLFFPVSTSISAVASAGFGTVGHSRSWSQPYSPAPSAPRAVRLCGLAAISFTRSKLCLTAQ